MKLGFLLKTTHGGEREGAAYNKEEKWANETFDVRSIIKDFKGFDGTAKFMHIIKFLGEFGYLIAIVKARPEGSGRQNDNTTAWIHIPNKVKIESENLSHIIEQIKKQLSARSNIDTNEIEKIFNKDYEEKNIYAYYAFNSIKSDDNKGIGVFKYGDDWLLHELIGDHLAQKKYNNYKCICLIDKKDGIELKNANDENNIKDSDLFLDRKNIITIPFPNQNDRKGYLPKVKINGRDMGEFRQTIEIPRDESVEVIWSKKGYITVHKKSNAINKDNTGNATNYKEFPAQLKIQDDDCEIKIEKSWFKITNKDNEINGCKILIDNQTLSQTLRLKESYLKSGVSIKVEKEGYNDTESLLRLNDVENILESNCPKTIEIQVKKKKVDYTLPKKQGRGLKHNATVTIERRETNSKEFPLKGYKVKRNKKLHYIGYRNNILCFLLGVTLSAFIGNFVSNPKSTAIIKSSIIKTFKSWGRTSKNRPKDDGDNGTNDAKKNGENKNNNGPRQSNDSLNTTPSKGDKNNKKDNKKDNGDNGTKVDKSEEGEHNKQGSKQSKDSPNTTPSKGDKNNKKDNGDTGVNDDKKESK